MSYEHIELFKRTLVKQQGYALTGGEFALLVLLVDTLLATANLGFGTLVEQFFYLFFKSHFYYCLIV